MTLKIMRTFVCLCVVTIGCVLIAASPADTARANVKAEPESKPMTTVVYRETPQGPLALEIFEPVGDEAGVARPAVVLFHGGGWMKGRPQQFHAYARFLAARGMVVICPEYRVSERHGTTPFESVDDAFAAFRYVRANAVDMGIDPERLAAGGGSAGGHLAAALATIDPATFSPETDAAIDPVPDALVLLNPVYDNSPDGYGHDRIGDRYEAFSPLHSINADMPPTIVLLGDEDKLIPVATAERFRDEQRVVGVRSELVIYPGADHGFFNRGRQPDGERYFRLVCGEIEAFFVSLDWIASADSE
ncbi:MAG: alpha/beta hydrolase [Planctomycetota bacterium]